MTSATDRLEELLDLKDNEIAELHEQLREYEKEERISEYRDAWEWTKHFKGVEDDKLPVPRLECRWHAIQGDADRYNWECKYTLVIRHLLGHIVHIPMGYTRTGGDHPPIWNGGRVDTPFRDGAHIAHDSATLKLPAFAIYEDKITRIEPREVKP